MKVKERTTLGIGLFLCSVACVLATLFGPPTGAQAEDPESDLLTIYVVDYRSNTSPSALRRDTPRWCSRPRPTGSAFWTPGPDTIGAFQKADLILLNGAGYAKWVEKASLPRSKVVDTSAEFKNKYIKIAGATTHSHGSGGEHAHEGVAFTTWLDLDLAAKQAGVIGNALVQMRPDLLDEFQSNYAMLAKDLKVDKSIRDVVSRNPW